MTTGYTEAHRGSWKSLCPSVSSVVKDVKKTLELEY